MSRLLLALSLVGALLGSASSASAQSFDPQVLAAARPGTSTEARVLLRLRDNSENPWTAALPPVVISEGIARALARNVTPRPLAEVSERSSIVFVLDNTLRGDVGGEQREVYLHTFRQLIERFDAMVGLYIIDGGRDNGTLVVSPTNNLATLEQALQRLDADGQQSPIFTRTGDALDDLDGDFTHGSHREIILVTDGVAEDQAGRPDIAQANDQEANRIVERAISTGVPVSVLGINGLRGRVVPRADLTRLERMAESTGGTYLEVGFDDRQLFGDQLIALVNRVVAVGVVDVSCIEGAPVENGRVTLGAAVQQLNPDGTPAGGRIAPGRSIRSEPLTCAALPGICRNAPNCVISATDPATADGASGSGDDDEAGTSDDGDSTQGEGSGSDSASDKSFFDAYGLWLLIAAGVLGLAGVAYAVFGGRRKTPPTVAGQSDSELPAAPGGDPGTGTGGFVAPAPDERPFAGLGNSDVDIHPRRAAPLPATDVDFAAAPVFRPAAPSVGGPTSPDPTSALRATFSAQVGLVVSTMCGGRLVEIPVTMTPVRVSEDTPAQLTANGNSSLARLSSRDGRNVIVEPTANGIALYDGTPLTEPWAVGPGTLIKLGSLWADVRLNTNDRGSAQVRSLRWVLRLQGQVASAAPQILVERNIVAVGRQPGPLPHESSLVVAHSDGSGVAEKLSGTHAKLWISDGRLVVLDLSSNGTNVNGQRIGKGLATTVEPGSTVSFGNQLHYFVEKG